MLLLRALIISSKAFFGLDDDDEAAVEWTTGADAVNRDFFFGVVVVLGEVRWLVVRE